MTYAVIQLVGKQYKVTEGEQIVVDRLEHEPNVEFKISDVLLVDDGTTAVIGTPLVDKAVVTLKVVENQRGDKIKVGKYRSKSRYRRTMGHRQSESVVEVLHISK